MAPIWIDIDKSLRFGFFHKFRKSVTDDSVKTALSKYTRKIDFMLLDLAKTFLHDMFNLRQIV